MAGTELRSTPAGRAAHTAARPTALTFAPGLDGLRALAVAAVVIYHVGARWLPGGFLGVDVFFVLSGFLITSLLVTEWRRDDRIDIGRFYLRRARRLLPALFVMLSVVVLVTASLAPGELTRLRGDVAAALGYSTNWTQIAWKQSYFQSLGPPSLLQHLWSLAVEEQFYLLWPLALLGCLATRRRWIPLAVTLAGIVTSTLLMASEFSPVRDPARVYYGSDTHAAPPLIGAALALLPAARRTWATDRRDRSRRMWSADLAAACGVAIVAIAMATCTYYRPGLYRGGYLIIGLASSAIVFAAAGPRTVTARVLGVAPLRWLGERSYGIYLWHWPVIGLTRRSTALHLAGPQLAVLQATLSVAAAAASYRLVERPVRSKGLVAAVRGAAVRRPRLRLRPVVIVLAAAGTVAAVAVQLLGPGVAAARSGARVEVDPRSRPTVIIAVVAPRALPSAVGEPSRSVPPPFPRPVRVGFFGDSQGMTLLLNRPDGLDPLLRLTDDTIEGCGILGGTISSASGQTRDLDADCAGWQSTWAAHAARDKPQIAVIEIGAWEVFDDRVNGTMLRFGTSGWDDYFDRQLASGIGVLRKAGSQVALLSVPCYQPISAGGLQALPERGDRKRTSHVNTLLRSAARAEPSHVFFIRSPIQFCNDPDVVGNTGYRWDGVHFYKPGAALEFRTIGPEFLAIPQP
jgi:peptidoglycan/LPS O-acetylase OafA/YrhL